MTNTPADFDAEYELDHRYTRDSGRIYLTGVQALVRLPLMQRQRDRAAGLNTAGFISGYRGSPLGTYDMALWQASDHLARSHIHFQPGVNEDLAATAVWGSQLVPGFEGARYDGVFGIWYGKGPGVDRSCDALKHGNYQGASEHGGVLVLAGDDPGARSSSIAHGSEAALIHMGIPVLHPATIQDYLDLGLYGWAMSRYSGCWIGFKCLTDTVESAASVSIAPERVRIVSPPDFEIGEGVRTGSPVASEEMLYHHRLPAVQAFARAHRLDRVILDAPQRRVGIVATGKAYLDVRQALEELGLDERRASDLGLCLYKVALTWPLEPMAALEFAEGLEHLLVVEEKRPLLEDQLKTLLYSQSRRPEVAGKRDRDGEVLVPDTGELSMRAVRGAIRSWLSQVAPDVVPALRDEPAASIRVAAGGPALRRMPTFCSGCPHNTSTLVPEGSVAGGGIGCHGMAAWMPSRHIVLFSHMGGEGANWIGISPFVDTPHIFQNLGDGTYFHSGLLAIRANVTAGTNITYKILNNAAVAMTGGQPIEGESLDGAVTTPEIVRQLEAEGVRRIAVVTNEPDKYSSSAPFPDGVTVHGREELEAVQRDLREIEGVSALVYDQICAAEARRLRRRGEFPDPEERVVINEAVCEGCGDCSVQSNCISIEPVETEFGRKRRINQSSCNKDFSCLRGHCPSFVTVRGGRLRTPAASVETPLDVEPFETLPLPEPADCSRPLDILVAGIGGSGVVTVGALLGMAAHLEGKGCSVLDVTGLAQKNGPVTSHVRIAADPEDLHATRIAAGSADLVLGCDLVVATSAENLQVVGSGSTTAIVNSHVTPTADFATNPDLDLSNDSMREAMCSAAGEDACSFVDATRLATVLLGDAIYANPFLMGFAYQRGCLPVGLAALERAIELNGRAIEANRRAFAWGRMAALDPERVERAAHTDRPAIAGSAPADLEALVKRRADVLVQYQDAAYAERYREFVQRVADRERLLGSGTSLAEAVARNYFKLLAYKDEYEVARLFSDGDFRRQIEAEFEGDYRLEWHAAPPRLPILDWFMSRSDAITGRTKKVVLGPWVFRFLGILARFRFLRGSPLDPFGRTSHRRMERQLIADYETLANEVSEALTPENRDLAVEIASLPEQVRGFDSVKEAQLRAAQSKQQDLLDSFRRRQ
ncbi:MAG: indolepyruvate ferredoxin oxidoreductase family protein [Myxococcota bacterium]